MRERLVPVLLVCALVPCLGAASMAQTGGTNADFRNDVIAVPLDGRSISVLVTHRPEDSSFTHAIALFPGSPGRGNLRVENGEIKFDKLLGNFLVRARRHFVEPGFLTVVIDAPSDRQEDFPTAFRASARYGADIRGVVDAIARRHGDLDWTFIGTSEGSVSAAQAARMVSPPAKRVVLTASLFGRSNQGSGLDLADVKPINIPLLWVHHRDDPCKATPYRTAKDFARDTAAPLVTVVGAKDPRGHPCHAFSEHGFVGMEIATTKAILAWIRTGTAPNEVGK